MKAGDTIKCNSLDDAFEYMDALMKEGYAVELEHTQSRTVLIITEVPKE